MRSGISVEQISIRGRSSFIPSPVQKKKKEFQQGLFFGDFLMEKAKMIVEDKCST
jgi:hypothetical protein